MNAPGAKVNGRTTLERAAEHGRLDNVSLLLDKEAGTKRKGDQQFVSATALVKKNGHFAVCDLIESRPRPGWEENCLEMLVDGNDEDFYDLTPAGT